MENNYALFAVDKRSPEKSITQVSLDKIYDNGESYRKAHLGPLPKVESGEVFVDKFKLEADVDARDEFGDSLKMRRIYEFYDQEFHLFEEKWFAESYIEDPDVER